MTDAVDLAHHVAGPREGAPVVLLHGFPLARGMWRDQVDALTGRGLRVVLPDLRGHGASPVGSGPATMERHEADLARLLDRLRLPAVTLAGFSLGGYVALEFVRRHPERVLALGLLDTRAEPDSDEARAKRAQTAKAVRDRGPIVLEESMLPKLITARTQSADPVLAEEVRRMIRAMPIEGAANALLGMAERPDQRPHLGRIQAPTLVVVGERDELTPPASSDVLAHDIPGARLVRVADAAHLTPMEAPEAVNAAFLDWLPTVAAAR